MYPFVTVVFAMGGGGGDAGSLLTQFIPLILIFAIFWFLVIRPQQKKAKNHRLMVDSLKKGDEIITDGGIQGTIQKVADNLVTLEIAPKVPIKLVRSRVAEVLRSSRSSVSKRKKDD